MHEEFEILIEELVSLHVIDRIFGKEAQELSFVHHTLVDQCLLAVELAFGFELLFLYHLAFLFAFFHCLCDYYLLL